MKLARIAISLVSSFAFGFPCGAAPTHAHALHISPALACELHLRTPLRFTFMEHFDVEHRGPAGQLYRPWQQIPDLPTGKYLYQIYRNGDVVIQPIHDLHGYFRNEIGVYTHANFVMEHVLRTGRHPRGEILASGEWIQAFGEVQLYTNRSGKWRGGPERVDFARRVLAERGLKFTVASQPVRIGVDSEDLGHTRDARLRDVLYMWRMADVMTHPYGHDRLLELYERLGRLLGKYTDNKTASSKAIMGLLRNSKVVGHRRDDLLTFVWPIIWGCTHDGMAAGIYRVWDNITLGQRSADNSFGDIGPYFLNNLLAYLASDLTPEHRTELEAIRDGFAALPRWIPPTTPPIGPYIDGQDDTSWLNSLPVRRPAPGRRRGG